jgi:hypothetical protein
MPDWEQGTDVIQSRLHLYCYAITELLKCCCQSQYLSMPSTYQDRDLSSFTTLHSVITALKGYYLVITITIS